jgi:hypothetical protein
MEANTGFAKTAAPKSASFRRRKRAALRPQAFNEDG